MSSKTSAGGGGATPPHQRRPRPSRPKTLADFETPGDGPPSRNVLIHPADHMFCAILTKALLSSGGIPPFVVYRFGPEPPKDAAGGTYVRGSTTEMETLDRLFKKVKIDLCIHLLLRNSELLDSGHQSEAEVYDVNVRDTNALLQALTRKQKKHSDQTVTTILVSGTRCHQVDDVLGNTILAAEALWFGRAVRQQWQSVVVRAAFSDTPWECPFIEWGFNIWDLGLHPNDLADAICIMAHNMTSDDGTSNGGCPELFRGTAIEITNVNLKLQPTNAELVLMEKYGLELMGEYDDVEEEAVKEEEEEANDGDDERTGSESKKGGGEVDEGKRGAAVEDPYAQFLQEESVIVVEEKEEDELVVARRQLIGRWKPQYRKRQLLEDLKTYGFQGPPLPSWLVKKTFHAFSNNDGVTAVHGGNYA